MKTQCDVIVVGGGASGLLCAVMLARKGVQVTVLEKNHRIGKKLSATGNGRCNFTNLHMNENCYYGNSKFIFSFNEGNTAPPHLCGIAFILSATSIWVCLGFD